MSDDAAMLLIQGVGFAQEGNSREARYYLERVLTSEPDTHQRAKAWLWLSRISDDPKEKQDFLEQILAYDLADPEARRDLAILQGRLKPEEIVDTTTAAAQPVARETAPAQPSSAMLCPKCSGRMVYSAESGGLACPYCGYQIAEPEGPAEAVEEHDFIATMLTARGHRWELPLERTLQCGGCGAAFTLPAGRLSGACPFCGSPQVVAASASEGLIEPEAVLPFGLDAVRALAQSRRWIADQQFKPKDLEQKAVFRQPQPVYLPFWSFDLGGAINWRAEVNEGDSDSPRWVVQTGQYPWSKLEVLVPAARTLAQEQLAAVLGSYDPGGLAPYSPDILSGWPAEVYTVPLDDASVEAHASGFEEAREECRRQMVPAGSRNATFGSAGLAIISFKLVLLPVFLVSYEYQGKSYPVAVSGSNGAVAGDVPRSRWQRALGGLFGG